MAKISLTNFLFDKIKISKKSKIRIFFAFNPDNFTPGITRPSSIFKFDFGGPAAAMAVEMDNDEFVCSVPFDPYVLELDVGYLTTPRQTGQIRHCRSFALKCA